MADLPSANPFRDLYDAAIRHTAVKMTCCRCRHSAIYSVRALWWYFDRKGWRDDFRHVQRRLVCMICLCQGGEKVRTPDLEFLNAQPTDTRFPEPPDIAWMQEQRRRR